MKILNYYFYSAYKYFERKHDMPLLRSVVYLTVICFFLQTLLTGFIADLFDCLPTWVLYGIMAVIFVCLYWYYGKNKKQIIREYDLKRKIKPLPMWLLAVSTFLSAIIGIASYFLLSFFIVHKFGLKGIMSNLLG